MTLRAECTHRHAPLVKVHIGLLAHQVGIPETHTLDLRQRVHNLALAVDIGVQKTQNVLRARVMANSQRSR